MKTKVIRISEPLYNFIQEYYKEVGFSSMHEFADFLFNGIIYWYLFEYSKKEDKKK